MEELFSPSLSVIIYATGGELQNTFSENVSDLLLNSCQKKQENQAAIFIRFSVDTANIPCNRFVNLAPLRVS